MALTRSRQMIREPAAEFFGVMIIIIFGNGVDCQVVLSGDPGVASSAHGVCICHVQPLEHLLSDRFRTSYPSTSVGPSV